MKRRQHAAKINICQGMLDLAGKHTKPRQIGHQALLEALLCGFLDDPQEFFKEPEDGETPKIYRLLGRRAELTKEIGDARAKRLEDESVAAAADADDEIAAILAGEA